MAERCRQRNQPTIWKVRAVRISHAICPTSSHETRRRFGHSVSMSTLSVQDPVLIVSPSEGLRLKTAQDLGRLRTFWPNSAARSRNAFTFGLCRE